ncbi:MAG TPA: SLC13 family permease [Acidimicrobiia bacterium]|nr:SLC13 family permease [Acidimicrobiia bacterium]
MTPEAWLTAAVVIAILAGLVLDVASPSVLVFTGVVVLLFAGVIDSSQALAGFSNPAPFTVAALFVLARAVAKTGAIRPYTQGLLGETGHTRRPMLRMLVPTITLSGMMNNIPMVAMMIPEVTSWARRRGSDVAKFLLPLAYGASLGGMMTLIGTSTNLVVAGQMTEAGMEQFAFFELGAIGLPAAILGLIALVALSPRLLAGRTSPAAQIRDEDVRDFSIQMEVVPDGALDGITVDEAGLRHLEGVFLVAIDRRDTVIAPARPDTVLRGGNRLTFVGRVDMVLDLEHLRGLRHAEHRQVSAVRDRSAAYFIVAIGGDSPLVGRTLKESGFRSRYQAAVLAIHRAGHRIDAKLGEVPIHTGDALVLLSDPGFRDRWAGRSDFLLISALDEDIQPAAPGGWLVVGILITVILLAALGIVPILYAALGAAILLIALRILTPDEARRAIDLEVIGVIASAFGLAAAMETSGLAAHISSGLVTLFGALGEAGVLAGVVLATIALTEFVTNNAAALLMFPIAVSSAQAAGVDPRGMAVAVAIAASACFLTPLGYQTNTMVYGPGGYRIADYLRVGAPLTLIVFGLVVWLVPVIYGL